MASSIPVLEQHLPATPTSNTSRILHDALKIPRTSHTVADFLFKSLLESTFHPNHAIPPSSLAHSLAVCSTSTVYLDPGPLDQPVPQDATIPASTLANSPNSDATAHDEKHCLFLPVAAHPPYSLGYCLAHEVSDHRPWVAMADLPKTFIARYVFDTEKKNSLFISYCAAKSAFVLRSMTCDEVGNRSISVACVPALEHGPGNLPTIARWCATKKEYLGIDPQHPIDTHIEEETVDSILNFRTKVPPLLPLRLSDVTSTSLPSNVHDAAINALTKLSFGVFHSPMMRIDFAHGQASVTSCVTSVNGYLPDPAASTLRKHLAEVYYSTILSISADAPLYHPPSQPVAQNSITVTDQDASSPASTLTGINTDEISNLTALPNFNMSTNSSVSSMSTRGQTVRTYSSEIQLNQNHNTNTTRITKEILPVARRIQPRPNLLPTPTIQSVRPTRGRPRGRADTPEALAEREQKRLARRERNRQSAARSNERRRQMVDTLKSDISSQQQRAKQLVERLRVVMADNTVLRKQVVESCASVSEGQAGG